MIKLHLQITTLNIYLLVPITEHDETVEVLLCKGTSSNSSAAKTFLSLHTKMIINLGKISKVKRN